MRKHQPLQHERVRDPWMEFLCFSNYTQCWLSKVPQTSSGTDRISVRQREIRRWCGKEVSRLTTLPVQYIKGLRGGNEERIRRVMIQSKIFNNFFLTFPQFHCMVTSINPICDILVTGNCNTSQYLSISCSFLGTYSLAN